MQMPNASRLHENVKPDNSGFEMQIFTTALNQSMLHRLCSQNGLSKLLDIGTAGNEWESIDRTI